MPGRPDVADRIVLVPAFDCDGVSDHDGVRGGAGGEGGRVASDGGAPEYFLIDQRRGWVVARH